MPTDEERRRVAAALREYAYRIREACGEVSEG